MLFHSVEKQSDKHDIKSYSQSQNLNTTADSMTKNKSFLKVCDFLSELSTINILRMLITVSIVMQCENTDDFVILKDSDSELINLEISKQKLKSL